MDPAHGALSYIYNSLTDTVWATENAQMGQFSYQTFNQSQFETFQNQYNSYCPPFCGVPDFVKPHLNETYSQSKHVRPPRLLLSPTLNRKSLLNFSCIVVTYFNRGLHIHGSMQNHRATCLAYERHRALWCSSVAIH